MQGLVLRTAHEYAVVYLDVVNLAALKLCSDFCRPVLAAFCHDACEKCRVDCSRVKLGMLHQLLMQSDVGSEAVESESCQGLARSES